MNAFVSQIDRYQYFKLVLMKGSNLNSRERLLSIVDSDIFNMKTICNISGIKYQTYCNSKRVNFENASDKWVDSLLDTIDNILEFYPTNK